MFTLVHAGNTYATRGGLVIYVKMRKRKGGYRELQTPNGTYLYLKDREIFITRRGFKEYNIPLFLEGFDYAVNLDIANKMSAVPSPGVMFIPENSSFSYDKKMFLPRKMFMDSGGFLLLTGSSPFIDPVDVARIYNKSANLGMALDLPLGPLSLQTKERIELHARIQKFNTNILKKNLDKSVTLYNISHGSTDEIRTRYMEIVQDDDLNHWACAGSTGAKGATPFDRLYSILTTIDNAGIRKLKSLHVLGVASVSFIPVLAWLGKYLDISSDASSAMKFASNYVAVESHGMKISPVYIGNNLSVKGKLRTKDFFPEISCSCSVCHALGSTEMFQKIGTYGASAPHTEVLWIHNQHAYDVYAASWNALASSLSPKEYKHQYSMILHKKDKDLVKAIDLIEDWTTSSAKKVCSKYKALMANSLGAKAVKAGDPAKFSLAVPQSNDSSLKATEEILNAAALRYIQYHGDKLAKYGKYLMKK